MKAGKCDAVISDQDNFKSYTAHGQANKDDCAAEEAGTLPKEEAFCVRDSATRKPVKNRDCGFGQVGDVLAAVPVAWAASPYLPTEIFHGLSWAIRQKLDEGALVTAESIFAETTPSECHDLTNKAASASLPISALFGSAAVSGGFVTIGILIALAQHWQFKADSTSSKAFKRKEENEGCSEDFREQDSDDEQEGKFVAVNTDIGSRIVALSIAHAKRIESLLKNQGTSGQIEAQSSDRNSSSSPRQPTDSDRLLGALARRERERSSRISILGFRLPSFRLPSFRGTRRRDDDDTLMADLARVLSGKSRDMPNVVPEVLPEDAS